MERDLVYLLEKWSPYEETAGTLSIHTRMHTNSKKECSCRYDALAKLTVGYNILTLKCVALCQIVIVSVSQNTGLHSSNQTLQISVINIKTELCHGAKGALNKSKLVQVMFLCANVSLFVSCTVTSALFPV